MEKRNLIKESQPFLLNALSERERNKKSSVTSQIHTDIERVRSTESEMMFTTSHNTIIVSLCPQKHNGQHKKQQRKQQQTTKKTTKVMTIKAMAKKGKSGSNNDEPEGFGFPKRYNSSFSFTSSRRRD